MTESTVAQGQQLLPLIDHLARVGRRAADAGGTGCLRPRHLIALKLLGEHGSLTQHALGAALSLDPSNVVGLLNELEDRDLITRRRDPADRRRHIVELSDSGSAELARAYREFGAVEDDLFKTLTAAERATLHTLLSRAVAGLAPACETRCAAGEAELSFPGSGKPATGTGGHDRLSRQGGVGDRGRHRDRRPRRGRLPPRRPLPTARSPPPLRAARSALLAVISACARVRH